MNDLFQSIASKVQEQCAADNTTVGHCYKHAELAQQFFAERLMKIESINSRIVMGECVGIRESHK